MAYTFGTQPADVVQDASGNALSGINVVVYPTKAQAVAQTGAITSLLNEAGSALPNPYVTTDSKGRFAFRVPSDPYKRVALRDPTGSIWQVVAIEVDDLKADLDVGGKLLLTQRPTDRAWPKYLGVVADQAAMLALSAAIYGDWVKRTDTGTTWVNVASPPSVLGNWVEGGSGYTQASIEEFARDALGTALIAGTNITITVNDGANTITIAAALDPTTAYTDGVIAAGDEWGVWYTGSAWPALTTVPLAYRNTGKPILWKSPFHLAAIQPPEMRNGDIWRRRVVA